MTHRSMSKKRRLTIYKRDKHKCRNPICIWHYEKPKQSILEIHHIHPFCEYPELDKHDYNLISLCHLCHSGITKDRSLSLDRWLRCIEYARNIYYETEKKFPPKKLMNQCIKISAANLRDE